MCVHVSLLYVHIYYLMVEKVIWLDIARVCSCIFTSHTLLKEWSNGYSFEGVPRAGQI